MKSIYLQIHLPDSAWTGTPADFAAFIKPLISERLNCSVFACDAVLHSTLVDAAAMETARALAANYENARAEVVRIYNVSEISIHDPAWTRALFELNSARAALDAYRAQKGI